ncbi:MAG: hypothetical protein PHI29_11970 [Gallionella sp.]|nr:hypothetical protein [Gallionella sp.]
MSLADLTATTIRHAVVRGARLDGLAARRGTERLLAQLPDIVSGVGPSAVLCVRDLSVRLQAKSRYSQSVGGILGDEMERLARHAARPAHGPVPLNAEAVLFADRAELLACVARDHLRHQLAYRWWWRVLLNTSDLSRVAAQLWLNEATYVPTALARLADNNDAAAFVRTLDLAEVEAVTRAVIRAHGLMLLAAEGVTVAPQQEKDTQLQSHQAVARASTPALEQQMRIALPEAWATGLNIAQRRLLVVGLSLLRLPRLVRSTAFAQALPTLLAQATAQASEIKRGSQPYVLPVRHDTHHPNENSAAHKVNGGGANELQSSVERIVSPISDEWVVVRSTIDKLRVNRLGASSDERIDGSIFSLPIAEFAAPEETLIPEPLSDTSTSLSQPQQPEKLEAATLTIAAALVPLSLEHNRLAESVSKSRAYVTEQVTSNGNMGTQLCDTQFGGVFFLCNAALSLDLYADFTRPLDRGLELPFWDFLALAATDLVGPKVRYDPLWLVLTELAGREEGQRLGMGFTPPSEWRMPPAWLEPFRDEADEWRWEADNTRLRVIHPAGFIVLDIRRNDMRVANQLLIESAAYRLPCIRPSESLSMARHAPLARWRAWVMPYLGRRVALALGDTNWRRACRTLLSLSGRVEWDTERLAVYFSLEQLPVAVRMAGLDRDPGWIPAAGRDLRFYFGCEHA